MTAKEQAILIYNEHYSLLLSEGDEFSQEVLISFLAKRASLITIENIIESTTDWSYSHNTWTERGTYLDAEKFWNEVKEEIHLL